VQPSRNAYRRKTNFSYNLAYKIKPSPPNDTYTGIYIYIYIYICRAVRSLKNQTTYIRTHICYNQCAKVWSNFVHSCYAYCGVLLCCGLLKFRASLCSHSEPPHPPPQPLQRATLLICQYIPTAHLSQLTNTIPDTACLVYFSNRS
jgi:hypothetical protein